ncbi:MAG TPA: MgtC/SapB family protein, partial [Alphaproteobacteria bacterium]|nr:MgtC/SapB family protein [Alphaproteobacteria bacterium]
MILDAFGILPLSELMLRLGIASLFGLVLGLDRELRGHEAGYRTHMLVALGAASMTVIGLELFLLLERIDPGSNADPLRIIEGVVAAIGFLGAGVIFQQRHTVRNV